MPNLSRRAIAAAAFALGAAPAAAQRRAVPTPESAFGFRVGAENRLVDYEQSVAYFRKLAAAASDRVRLVEVGKTSFGKPWTVAVISSPANLARLAELRRINQRLAHPDGLTDAEARRLARTGKAFVDISGGLHASEIAGSQHTPQLAYELLSRADEPAVRRILDETVLVLWPSINPDGQDVVVDWCRARFAGKNPPPMELYQKYIGHDNNRDAYMLNVVESRVIQRTWREWEPHIIYVHHQSSPFPTRIWVPPFADPVGLRVPPLMAREVNTIGTTIAQALEEEGKPGTVHQGDGFDAWYPGYIDYMPMYQNIPAFWTETQGGNCGAARTSTVDSLPAEYRDLQPKTMYPSPWPGGTWTNRDAVDYMVTASRATLAWAAANREQLLYNRFQAGRNTIRKYRAGPPYAYLVPQRQHDPVAPVELLRRLAFLGVRVSQTDRDITYEGVGYPAGTWVIPMDQEYAELVRELLEPQRYPDMGDDLPYDAAGWTLPYQMDVEVVEGKAPLTPALRAALKPVRGTPTDAKAPDAPLTTNAAAAGIVAPAGGVTGAGDALALPPAQNDAYRLINRALAAGGTLRLDGGRWLVAGVDTARAGRWARELGVRAELTNASPAAVAAPTRIALYKAGPGIMDEGWTEWLLDTYGFRYTVLGPADVRAGNLGARFDVLLLASQSLTGGGGRGLGGGGGAQPAVPDSLRARNDLLVRAVDEFVTNGGTVVAWNQGTASAIAALGLPVRNVLAGVARRDHFTGGSILRVVADPAHPVMAGMPAQADVFVNSSPAFTTLPGFEGSVLAKYPTAESPLRSGFLSGAAHIQGYAAAVDAKHGGGHVVLLAFQPQWRGQPTGTFRVVFNSLFYARALAEQARGTPGFWSPPPAAPATRADSRD